jgi:hypothetical protein
MWLNPHLLYVSRPWWLRFGDVAAGHGRALAAAGARAVDGLRARVQRDRERAALRHLSPHVLRDIGAGDDMLADALARERTRGTLAEPWRHGL